MRALVVAFAMLCALASGATAAAGGWAVTALDTVPSDMQPGRSYSIGYTIKQHNETPVTLEGTAIVITSLDSGKTARFAGKPQGPTGHHVAQVTFPEAGRWAWEAHQDWFGPYKLGIVQVGPVAAVPAAPRAAQPAPAAMPAPAPASDGLAIGGLLIALALAAIGIGAGMARPRARERA